MKTLQNVYARWASLPPVKFVVVTTFLSILLTVIPFVFLKYAGINISDINSPDIRGYGLPRAILLGVILAPFLETFIGQVLPIYLVQRFVRWQTNLIAVLISTLLFSIAHAGHSIYYPVIIMPTALLLALTYVVFQHRTESNFLMTFFVHAFKNLLAVIAAFSTMI